MSGLSNSRNTHTTSIATNAFQLHLWTRLNSVQLGRECEFLLGYMKRMSFDFTSHITKLDPAQKLHFYELLAHHLTVSVRSICANASLDARQKVEQIRWINEVSHQITAKIYVLRLNTHTWTEDDIWQRFQWAIRQNVDIKGYLAEAIMHSYNSVISNSSA